MMWLIWILYLFINNFTVKSTTNSTIIKSTIIQSTTNSTITCKQGPHSTFQKGRSSNPFPAGSDGGIDVAEKVVEMANGNAQDVVGGKGVWMEEKGKCQQEPGQKGRRKTQQTQKLDSNSGIVAAPDVDENKGQGTSQEQNILDY